MVQLKRFIFMLVLLILIVNIKAIPTQTQTKGFIIIYPDIQYLKQNEAYTFDFHVYNNTNGYPVTSGVSLILHLYNSSGSHILQATPIKDSNGIDYKYFISGGNFSSKGQYSYIIQVNDTNSGGSDKVFFEVTPSGRMISEGESIIYSVFFIFAVLIFLTSVYITSLIPFASPKQQKDFTAMLKPYRTYKIGLILFDYLLMIFIIAMSMSITRDYLLMDGFYNFFKYLYVLLITPIYPVVIVSIILFLIFLFKDILDIKKIGKFMNGGYNG